MNYEKYKQMNLHIDLSRGKPSKEQLDICMPWLSCTDYFSNDGTDCRNYGLIDGINESKQLFAEIFECKNNEVFVGGNSSLNLLYSILEIGILKGFLESDITLFEQKKKMLCQTDNFFFIIFRCFTKIFPFRVVGGTI